MRSTKLFALTIALWASSKAMRIGISSKQEDAAKELEIEVAKQTEEEVAHLDDDDAQTVVQTKDDSNSFARNVIHRRRTLDDRRRTTPNPWQHVLPHNAFDANPIGLGTIPGSHSLLVMVFGGNKGISTKDLQTVVLDRRFPKSYKYDGPLQRRKKRPRRETKLPGLPRNFFVSAHLKNVNFIICPFLSTLMNEGALKLKQTHTRKELSDATKAAGLPSDTTDEHVGDNFENNPQGVFDIWNLEGETDEHQSSTGINDCLTVFTYCGGAPGARSCKTSSDRSCSLPNEDRFKDFIKAVDTNVNGFITIDELQVAADRANLDRLNKATTILS